MDELVLQGAGERRNEDLLLCCRVEGGCQLCDEDTSIRPYRWFRIHLSFSEVPKEFIIEDSVTQLSQSIGKLGRWVRHDISHLRMQVVY